MTTLAAARRVDGVPEACCDGCFTWNICSFVFRPSLCPALLCSLLQRREGEGLCARGAIWRSRHDGADACSCWDVASLAHSSVAMRWCSAPPPLPLFPSCGGLDSRRRCRRRLLRCSMQEEGRFMATKPRSGTRGERFPSDFDACGGFSQRNPRSPTDRRERAHGFRARTRFRGQKREVSRHRRASGCARRWDGRAAARRAPSTCALRDARGVGDGGLARRRSAASERDGGAGNCWRWDGGLPHRMRGIRSRVLRSLPSREGAEGRSVGHGMASSRASWQRQAQYRSVERDDAVCTVDE